VIQNLIDFRLSLYKAVNNLRYHMQWLPDYVYMEPNVFSYSLQNQLRQMGYQLKTGTPYGFLYMGAITAITFAPSGRMTGVMDSRRPAGLALGY